MADREYGIGVLRDTCAMLRRNQAHRRAIEAAKSAMGATPPRSGQAPPAPLFAVGIAFYATQGQELNIGAVVAIPSDREGV